MKEFLQNPEAKKKIAIGLAAVLVLGAGYSLYRNVTNRPVTEKIVPLVRTITVGETLTDSANTYPGEVRGRYESQLAFQVAGKIISRQVNVGDRVLAGQVLMSLDPKDVNQNVEAADAQLSSAIANQKLAADNAARYNALYAQGAVSEATRDQYNTQLDAANASLRQAQAQVNSSNNQLSYTQLVSDADGVVAAINGEVGQVAGAGNPMVTVVRSGEREVQINVPENAQLSIGQKAVVSFWALPNIKVDGSIREIAPMADPVTRTYKVCVSVPDIPAEAKLGMTAKVSFVDKEDTQKSAAGFTIPAAALYQVNNKLQVWVVRNNHAHLVDVTINGYVGNNVNVSGLAKGDVIITAGLSKLTPDQEVRLAEGGEV